MSALVSHRGRGQAGAGRAGGLAQRFRDFVGVSVKEDGADGDPVSGVVLLGISCAADSSYKQMTES